MVSPTHIHELVPVYSTEEAEDLSEGLFGIIDSVFLSGPEQSRCDFGPFGRLDIGGALNIHRFSKDADSICYHCGIQFCEECSQFSVKIGNATIMVPSVDAHD